MTPADAEAARIRAEYDRREREIGRDFYSLTHPTNLFARHGQERALLRGLIRAETLPFGDKRVLEIGCGRGQWLGVLENFGARRDYIAGIDLDPARLKDAQQRYPHADLRVGDAAQLPWESGRFDLILQSTVFTSILDPVVRRAVASEMRRVLATRGVIVWYDFRYNNPKNANVRGIGARELTALFPDCSLDLESATLAPPLARRIVPRSWLAAALLERLRVLNTHYLAVIRLAKP